MRLFLALLCLFMLSASAHALEGAVPGRSQWGVALGTPRMRAVALLQQRFSSLEPRASHTTSRARGLTEDVWAIPVGNPSDQLHDSKALEILSRAGKVVQIRAWSSASPDGGALTFAQLVRRHRLKERAYGFDDPGGGGYVGFYYDDIKRGVCFCLSVQDDFLLTYKPDAIIIHPPGVPAIPIEGGLHGKPESGTGARVYANAAEARRTEDKERNDY